MLPRRDSKHVCRLAQETGNQTSKWCGVSGAHPPYSRTWGRWCCWCRPLYSGTAWVRSSPASWYWETFSHWHFRPARRRRCVWAANAACSFPSDLLLHHLPLHLLLLHLRCCWCSPLSPSTLIPRITPSRQRKDSQTTSFIQQVTTSRFSLSESFFYSFLSGALLKSARSGWFPPSSCLSLTAVRTSGGVYVTAPLEPCCASAQLFCVSACVCEVQLSGKWGSWLFSPGEIRCAAAESRTEKRRRKEEWGRSATMWQRVGFIIITWIASRTLQKH